MRHSAIATVVAFAALTSCGGSPDLSSRASSPAAPQSPAPPAPPTSWAISGRILRAGDLAPLAGASIVYGDAPAVSSDAEGRYTIVTVDSSTRPLVISLGDYYRRETSLQGGAARTGVDFDLIGPDPLFPRQEFVDVVHNAYEGPNFDEPSRRWTENPNVYIRTLWRDDGAAVDPGNVAFLLSEIRRAIPQWSANVLQAGTIETGTESRAPRAGWINIQFGRSGNWSTLGENPGIVQFGSEGTCQSLAIFHELGHTLGYWHTRIPETILGRTRGTCTLWNLGPNEAAIARVMYGRAPGNLTPDKDGPPPPPVRYLRGHSTAPRVVYCDLR